MTYQIGQIPTHDSTPPLTAKMEIENPTGPASEYCTLAEMLVQYQLTQKETWTASGTTFSSTSNMTTDVALILMSAIHGSASGVSGTFQYSTNSGGAYTTISTPILTNDAASSTTCNLLCLGLLSGKPVFLQSGIFLMGGTGEGGTSLNVAGIVPGAAIQRLRFNLSSGTWSGTVTVMTPGGL